ncbi:MAG: arylesterase [Allosphingosinicella sp.]|uniref:arylesterase n=1 Tax=Allosphingosinicella sp. TaxID=2823234 RepID=UPI00394E9A45
MRSGKKSGSEAALYGRRRFLVHAALAGLGLPIAAAAQQRPAAGDEVHIFALGDSLTAGFGLPRELGFVPQLEAHLRRHGVPARLTNAGVSGDTAAQGLQRLAWTLDGLARTPDLAIVALGANDMLRGLPVAQTRAALDAILAELGRRQIKMLLAGMIAAPNLGQDYARAYNPMFSELARAHGAAFHPFFLEGVAGDRTLNQADGIHPNFPGVKRMVSTITPRVVEVLRQ